MLPFHEEDYDSGKIHFKQQTLYNNYYNGHKTVNSQSAWDYHNLPIAD